MADDEVRVALRLERDLHDRVLSHGGDGPLSARVRAVLRAGVAHSGCDPAVVAVLHERLARKDEFIAKLLADSERDARRIEALEASSWALSPGAGPVIPAGGQAVAGEQSQDFGGLDDVF